MKRLFKMKIDNIIAIIAMSGFSIFFLIGWIVIGKMLFFTLGTGCLIIAMIITEEN